MNVIQRTVLNPGSGDIKTTGTPSFTFDIIATSVSGEHEVVCILTETVHIRFTRELISGGRVDTIMELEAPVRWRCGQEWRIGKLGMEWVSFRSIALGAQRSKAFSEACTAVTDVSKRGARAGTKQRHVHANL